ncbi:MAG: ABC transporter ATP-binding protein [Clostridia bacterium]|nr:ABC transporter ATP-binding protein [Clostridia bacterium]
MVRFEHVTKAYPNGRFAVRDLDLEIEKGEFVCLIGPSGCGKTTTLKMVNRLIEPTSGSIYVDGQDVRTLDRVELRRSIGYVIQQIGLFPHMTIAANVELVPRLLGWSKERREARVRELLTLVGMDPDEYADRYPHQLSGGQQQRIGVLRALAAEPPLILMDEPFGALDPITRETLQDELKSLQSKLHKTIIFVTHDMDEALKLADRVVIMRDGVVVQAAPPEDLLRNPADEFVEAFVGKRRVKPAVERVEDVMLRKPVVMEAHRGVAEAVERMKRRRVDTVLVVEGDRFAGVLHIDDVPERVQRMTVGELCRKDVPVIAPDALAQEAFTLMRASGLRLLPVVDESGVLHGLVTRTSMVDALASAVWGEGA